MDENNIKSVIEEMQTSCQISSQGRLKCIIKGTGGGVVNPFREKKMFYVDLCSWELILQSSSDESEAAYLLKLT